MLHTSLCNISGGLSAPGLLKSNRKKHLLSLIYPHFELFNKIIVIIAITSNLKNVQSYLPCFISIIFLFIYWSSLHKTMTTKNIFLNFCQDSYCSKVNGNRFFYTDTICCNWRGVISTPVKYGRIGHFTQNF